MAVAGNVGLLGRLHPLYVNSYRNQSGPQERNDGVPLNAGSMPSSEFISANVVEDRDGDLMGDAVGSPRGSKLSPLLRRDLLVEDASQVA
jgi:hypothetical protein